MKSLIELFEYEVGRLNLILPINNSFMTCMNSFERKKLINSINIDVSINLKDRVSVQACLEIAF